MVAMDDFVSPWQPGKGTRAPDDRLLRIFQGKVLALPTLQRVTAWFSSQTVPIPIHQLQGVVAQTVPTPIHQLQGVVAQTVPIPIHR